MNRALVLGGGPTHGFDQGCVALVEIMEEAGLACDVIEEPADVAALDHDLLAVDALWWTMGAERYADRRAQWARTLPGSAREAIEAHVGLGRSVLGVHTAAICFDDWSRWGHILGGAWDWERSSHPPLDDEHPISVTITSRRHPITEGLADFDVIDEAYGFMGIEADVEGLATVSHGGAEHPALWARTLPSGSRVVYDALGHDRRSMDHPTHRQILRRSLDWLLA